MNDSTNQMQNPTFAIEDTPILQESIKKKLASIEQMSLDDKQAKNEDVKSMIHYYNDLTQDIEDRRTRVAEFTWQSLGIIVTAFGVIVALQIISLVKLPILVILGAFFLVSLFRLREYQVQSGFKYPFLKFSEYGNKWKWFYHGNPYIKQINERPSAVSKTEKTDQLLYLEGLDFFLHKYTEESIDRELTDNIIQLYLLQVHNYYKNRFYLRLFKYDKWMLWLIVGGLIAYCIFVLIVWLNYPNIQDFLLTKSF